MLKIDLSVDSSSLPFAVFLVLICTFTLQVTQEPLDRRELRETLELLEQLAKPVTLEQLVKLDRLEPLFPVCP